MIGCGYTHCSEKQCNLTLRENTKIKTASSVDKGCTLIWIVVTNNSFRDEVNLNTNIWNGASRRFDFTHPHALAYAVRRRSKIWSSASPSPYVGIQICWIARKNCLCVYNPPLDLRRFHVNYMSTQDWFLRVLVICPWDACYNTCRDIYDYLVWIFFTDRWIYLNRQKAMHI